MTDSSVHSFRWHVQNATIPCRSRQLLPFLSVMYLFLPPFSTNYSSILPYFILPSISWSTSQSYLLLPNSYIIPFWGILFSSILCTCQNQCKLFNLIVSNIAGFLTLAWISLLVNFLQFSFSLSYTGSKILLYTFLAKMSNCFLSLFVSIQVSDAHVNVSYIIVFFSLYSSNSSIHILTFRHRASSI